MDMIQLKVPPDVLTMVADAIERDVAHTAPPADAAELIKFHTWLRYRLARWDVRKDPTDGS